MINKTIRSAARVMTATLKYLITFLLLLELSLSPRVMVALAATPPATTAAKPTQPVAGANRRQTSTAQPAPRRISLKALDLSRVPTEEELKMAGQLGGPLSPSAPANPAAIADPHQRQKQESDNMLFGQAIQQWNQHHYAEATTLFRQHRQTYPESPWAGEAELHLGCAAQFSGSWQEAGNSFDWILGHHQKGSDIYQKAKLRRTVLYFTQGQFEEAMTSFGEMLETETDWGRRTYAQSWIRQLSLYKAHETALRDCGAKSLAYILRRQGKTRKAQQISRALAPTARGFSIGELAASAKNLGLHATAVRANQKQLQQLATPFIAHYSDQHFVVVTGFGSNHSVKLFDPRLGHPSVLTDKQFTEQWSGLALIFKRRPGDVRLASTAVLSRETGGCCGFPPYMSDLGVDPDCPPECSVCTAPPPQGMPAWQVNRVSLNLVVQDIPMWYDSEIGPKIQIQLTYNSQDGQNQLRPFGNKWVLNYASYTMESPNSNLPAGSTVVVMPDARGDTYQPDNQGGFTPPPGVFNKLTKLSDYTFDLQLLDGTIYHYGVPPEMTGYSSLLLSIEDRNHNFVTVTHDSNGMVTGVKDAQNRLWSLTYNAQGLVERVDDPFGRNAQFSYDTNDNLTGQTDMGGVSYGYTYDTNANPLNVYLTSITKPSGTTGFYVEPSSGTGGDYYPPPGAAMGTDYRVTVTDPLGFKEEYYYSGNDTAGWYRDKNQYLQTGIDEDAVLAGPKTKFNYTVLASNDSTNHAVVSSITYADGKTFVFSNFNAARQPQTITDENAHTTILTYNSMGRVLTRQNARGYITTYTYASNNIDLIKVNDAAHVDPNFALQLGYDGNRNVNSIVDGLTRTTSILYNTFGQPQTITDPTMQVRTFNYNTLHQLTSITQNGNTLVSIIPDAVGRPGTVTNQNGYPLVYTYDGLNRVERVTYPGGTFTQNVWGCCHLDGHGDRAGNYTWFTYDPLNRLVVSDDAKDRVTEYVYDPVGNLIKLVDPNRNTTQWQYDNRNRVSKKIYADGSAYSYLYDGVGNLKQQTDAKQVVTTYSYDEVNNFTGISASSGLSPITFYYDEINRLYQMTDGTGATVFYYDLANQLTSIDGPLTNDKAVLSYDLLGRYTGHTINNTGAHSLVYDNYGRLQTVTNPLGTFTYNYPLTTNYPVSTLLRSITSGSRSTNFLYLNLVGGDQRLAEIWNKYGSTTFSKFDYQYNVLGEITKWTQQAGTNPAQAYTLAYDSVGQLKSGLLNDVTSGALLKSYSYDYDQTGNRSVEAIDTLVTGETSNDLNQLSSQQSGTGVLPIRGTTNEPASLVTVNGAPATVKTDNTFEGKATVTAGNNTVTVVATDVNGNTATNRYNVSVTGSGTKSLVYDANGNLTTDGTKIYEWDPLNRLTAINNGTLRSEFTYNGLNQRVQIVEKNNGTVTSTKNLIWVGSEICEARTANNTRRYYPQGMQMGTTNFWYTRDHLGSIRELTNSSGAVVTRYDYDLYGRRTKVTGTTDADFGFTEHYYHSPSNLHLAQYRAYSADFGRWISRDPIHEAGGTNLYGYVANNPISLVDPVGLKFVIDPAADRDWRRKTANDLKKVERDLKKNLELNPNDPCAKKHYDDFMALKNDPDYEVFISPHTGGNYYDPNDQSVNFDAWNPFGGYDADGSDLRDASVGLGHEIGHAIDDYNGGLDYGPSSNPAFFPDGAEESAVMFENSIRNGRWPNDPGRQRPSWY